MKIGEASNIHTLLEEQQAMFIVPEYQRPYSWDKRILMIIGGILKTL